MVASTSFCAGATIEPGTAFPPALGSYPEAADASLLSVLGRRISAEPFNIVASLIFLCAVIHTFFSAQLLRLAQAVQLRHQARLHEKFGPDGAPAHLQSSVGAALLHFLGEVEAVFGIWVVPLLLALWMAKGLGVTRQYINHGVSYTEPLFVVVIMAIASSRPIIEGAERGLGLLAGNSAARWWLTLLTLGPLLGSLITEPAAMTICALLLGREFYHLEPSLRFKYATLGLLFVNISVGGAFTNFAAPPVLMVAAKWGWSTPYLLEHFGWRLLGGIAMTNLLYFFIFRREFAGLNGRRRTQSTEPTIPRPRVPWSIVSLHSLFLFWTVLVAHEPALFIGGFLIFLAFTAATSGYQDDIQMRGPLLVGFFLAGLKVHGGLQGWWIEPVLRRLDPLALLGGATILTAFNDNAAITYLATLVPDFGEELKRAVVAGAICGGGLTVIANAPNPAGQSLLQRYFPDGIKPGGLFLAALGPTLIMVAWFVV